jgi:hypothetical protein
MLGMGNINTHRPLVEKCPVKPSICRLKGILESAINKGVQGIETLVDKAQL